MARQGFLLSGAEQNCIEGLKHANRRAFCPAEGTEVAVTSSGGKYSSTPWLCSVQINQGGQ